MTRLLAARRREIAYQVDQRGTAAVFGVVLGVLGLLVIQGLAVLGAGAVAQARADAAADAAALAAADQLALGYGESAAQAVALSTAADNGAELVRCDCTGMRAEVSVAMVAPGLVGLGERSVVGSAQAEVRWSFMDAG